MNKADNLSEKSCNSLVFEDEAKVLTFACITTDNVKDAPLLLGEVVKNKIVAPENAAEAKQLASNAEKLKKQQIEKLEAADAGIPHRSQQKYKTIEEILNDNNLPISAQANAIFYNFRNKSISLADCELYLKNHPDKSKTDYRKLLCAYDHEKYGYI